MSQLAPEVRSGAGKPAGKGRVVLALFALAAFAALIALGLWQLQRRDWKNDIIQRFEEALAKPPARYQPPQQGASERQREFTRVTAEGAFEDGKTVKVLTPAPELVRARTNDGFGYLLFTPLKTKNGVVFVNRGFVPESLAGQARVPAGETTVSGIVRLSQSAGSFTPAPDFAKRLFFTADLPAMVEAAGLNGAETAEYIEAEPSPQAAEWPKARDPHELLAAIPNRHLEYALTWFGLAAALAGVFGAFIARR